MIKALSSFDSSENDSGAKLKVNRIDTPTKRIIIMKIMVTVIITTRKILKRVVNSIFVDQSKKISVMNMIIKIV